MFSECSLLTGTNTDESLKVLVDALKSESEVYLQMTKDRERYSTMKSRSGTLATGSFNKLIGAQYGNE